MDLYSLWDTTFLHFLLSHVFLDTFLPLNRQTDTAAQCPDPTSMWQSPFTFTQMMAILGQCWIYCTWTNSAIVSLCHLPLRKPSQPTNFKWKMVQEVRALVFLEKSTSVCSIHMWLITICKFSSRGFNALFWTPRVLQTQNVRCVFKENIIHIKYKKRTSQFKNIFQLFVFLWRCI